MGGRRENWSVNFRRSKLVGNGDRASPFVGEPGQRQVVIITMVKSGRDGGSIEFKLPWSGHNSCATAAQCADKRYCRETEAAFLTYCCLDEYT